MREGRYVGRTGFLRTDGGDVLLRVFAKTRSSKNRICVLERSEVHVEIAAPPVEGAANRELCRFIASLCRLPKSRVVLEKGDSSRHKLLRLRGVRIEEIGRRLGVSTKLLLGVDGVEGTGSTSA